VALHDLNAVIPARSCEILIANNDSAPLPKTIKRIVTNALYTEVYNLSSNQGFGVANNYIAKKAQGTYLFFLNPDTYNFSGDLMGLVKMIEQRVCDVIAPTITNADGSPQVWSYGKMITPRSIVSSNLLKNDTKSGTGFQCDQATKDVDWVTGAAFLIKKTDFQEVGGFDERFFLYFEDIDLCKRLVEKEKKILVSQEMKLKHKSGASAKNSLSQKAHYYKAQNYYLKKHYGKTVAKVFSLLRGITHPL